jgi:hypothetical protein
VENGPAEMGHSRRPQSVFIALATRPSGTGPCKLAHSTINTGQMSSLVARAGCGALESCALGTRANLRGTSASTGLGSPTPTRPVQRELVRESTGRACSTCWRWGRDGPSPDRVVRVPSETVFGDASMPRALLPRQDEAASGCANTHEAAASVKARVTECKLRRVGRRRCSSSRSEGRECWQASEARHTALCT